MSLFDGVGEMFPFPIVVGKKQQPICIDHTGFPEAQYGTTRLFVPSMPRVLSQWAVRENQIVRTVGKQCEDDIFDLCAGYGLLLRAVIQVADVS